MPGAQEERLPVPYVGGGRGWGRQLTGAQGQALAVLLQPLDALLQLAVQRVIQQQLLALEGGACSARGGGGHPPGARVLTSRCCLAPCSSHSYLFLITSRQKPL